MKGLNPGVMAQVVETSVTVNNNSPIQDYVHPDNQTQPFSLNNVTYFAFYNEIMTNNKTTIKQKMKVT